MYSVMETPNGRALLKLPQCRNTFTAGGKLVKFGKDGMVLLPKNTKVAVCKILHWEMQAIRMTKNKQMLYHNSNIAKYELSGDNITIDEEEILLASLEVLETL